MDVLLPINLFHSTEDAAAEASGFTSYNAYVKAKERLQK